MKKFKIQKAYLLFAFILGCFVGLAGCSGNEGGGGEWTQPTTISTGPTVTSTIPANLATGVPTNRRITATFSEVMDSATITTATFKVTGPLAVVVTGTVTYSGQTAVFAPSAVLATNSLYTATITTGAKNPTGVAMVANYTWSFTTGLTTDTTAPTLISTGAFDGETGLPVNRDATATFSEPMLVSTIASPATTFTVCAAGTGALPVACVSPSIAGVVSYLGSTATFNPDVDLSPDTWYTSQITAGAMDLTGVNALAPGLIPNPWSWKTGNTTDITAPTVTVTNPVNLATNIPIDKKINATFSEEMRQASMVTTNFTMKETVSGNNVNGTVAYDVQNDIVTFSPLLSLTADTDYTMTVTNGAKDLAGNALVVPAVGGLPVPNPWTFRTAPASVPLVPLAINLGSAATFGIAAGAGMTSTGITTVNGDVALSPTGTCTDAAFNCAAATYQNAAGLTVNGTIFFAGDTDPAGSGVTASAVKNDLNTAWLQGMAKVATMTVAGDQLSSVNHYAPGVYLNANLNMAVGGLAILDGGGDANATFIFKVTTDLSDSGIVANPSVISLTGGTQAKNVWFVVGNDATIGDGSIWNGNVLAGNDLTINTGAKMLGRALSGAVNAGAGAISLLNGASITVPE